MPAGYIIVNLTVDDPKTFEEYRVQVPPTLAAYDGEYLVRGGAMEVLEGETSHSRVVVLKFPSVARAKEWHASVEYAGPKALRRSASHGLMLAVEGLQ